VHEGHWRSGCSETLENFNPAHLWSGREFSAFIQNSRSQLRRIGPHRDQIILELQRLRQEQIAFEIEAMRYASVT
jgi:hypothetical protein